MHSLFDDPADSYELDDVLQHTCNGCRHVVLLQVIEIVPRGDQTETLVLGTRDYATGESYPWHRCDQCGETKGVVDKPEMPEGF